MSDLEDRVRPLPKVELHQHVDGSMLQAEPMDFAAPLLADDFIGNSPTGVATKAQNIAEAKTNAPDITNATYVADEYTVRFLDPNTAVMTHRAVEKGLNKGKEYNDQHRSMHVWVKRDGRWQVVASQATPILQK